MTIIKEYIEDPSKLKKVIRFVDGIAIRYIPTFFMLAIANGLVLKIMFDQKVSNKLTAFFLSITSLVVSILWTRMATKIEYSLFHNPLPSYIKKKALSKRGTSIIIFYILLKAMRSTEPSSNILITISRKLVEFSFSLTILVLIVTFVIIALRRPLTRY